MAAIPSRRMKKCRSAKVVVGKKAAFVEGCEGAQKAKVKALGFEAEHLSYSRV